MSSDIVRIPVGVGFSHKTLTLNILSQFLYRTCLIVYCLSKIQIKLGVVLKLICQIYQSYLQGKNHSLLGGTGVEKSKKFVYIDLISNNLA